MNKDHSEDDQEVSNNTENYYDNLENNSNQNEENVLNVCRARKKRRFIDSSLRKNEEEVNETSW